MQVLDSRTFAPVQELVSATRGLHAVPLRREEGVCHHREERVNVYDAETCRAQASYRHALGVAMPLSPPTATTGAAVRQEPVPPGPGQVGREIAGHSLENAAVRNWLPGAEPAANCHPGPEGGGWAYDQVRRGKCCWTRWSRLPV